MPQIWDQIAGKWRVYPKSVKVGIQTAVQRGGPSREELVNQVLDLETGPYLAWVTPSERAKAKDPLDLPRREGLRRVLWVTETLGSGGAERIVETAARWLSENHDVMVWRHRTNGAAPQYSHLGGAVLVNGPWEDVAENITAFRPEIIFLSNCGCSEHTKELRATGAKVVYIPYGLTSWNIKMMGGEPDAWWAYDRVCGGLYRMGYRQPMFALRGPLGERPRSIRRPRRMGPVHVGYVGRMSGEKALPKVADFVWRLSQKMPRKVVLDVFGGVSVAAPEAYRNHFQTHLNGFHQSTEYALLAQEKMVVEHGICAIDDIYNNMDAVVLVSDFEGEPLVYLEAMARGVLCVGRGIGQIPDLLDGCGVMSRPTTTKASIDELEALAGQTAEVLRNRAEYGRLTDAALVRVMERHAKETWVDQAERVIAEVARW